MVQAKKFQRCLWCGESEGKLTDDHVFPRELGGTRQLAVPACDKCQTIISRAEREVGRRSPFALYRIDKGPAPRHKERPDSGAVEARYVLVKDWMGGYSEVVPRAHRDPITLPCIEIDLATFNARARGATPEDVRRLIEAVLKVVEGPPDESGFLGEVSVDLLPEEASDIAIDPDFWPRALLDLRGQLRIRARNGQEAKRLLEVIVYFAQRGVFKDLSGWATGQVPTGTPHHFLLEGDYPALLRVVAKIACATAYCRASPKALESESLCRVRNFVLGIQETDEASPVRQISSVGSVTEWPDHHIVLLESHGDQLQDVVVLYGTCFIVDLGENPLPEVFAKPVVAMSRRDGTHTEFVVGAKAETVVETLKSYVEKLLNKRAQ